MLPFSVVGEETESTARAAELTTPHGVVHTPAFMPVGTAGTVKGMASWELERLGPEMILANTYHLLLRLGTERISLGGLHRVMGWQGPILTDSGGYQVYSLAKRRKVETDGVVFRSHIDGSEHRLTPESVIETQASIGVDVAMVLDECLPYPVEPRQAEKSTMTSVDWALRGLERAGRFRAERPQWGGGVFAIQQGSLDFDLRRRCTEALAAANFDGFAIGGLAVGEPPAALYEAVSMTAPMLPADRPRYLMGVGYPEDILHAVGCGVDLFDCVLPTRSARTGKVFTSMGDLAIKNARHADDPRPLDESWRRLFSRRSAPSLRGQRGDLGGAADHSQPLVLSELDARGSGSYHGGPLHAVPRTGRERSQQTPGEKTGLGEVNHGECRWG